MTALLSRMSPRQSLEYLLERNHKGYAYDLLQLQIAIEDQATVLGSSKIDDITKLIQMYMVGVEALEGAEDPRFRYFSGKLQSLMLKRPVAEQLRMASNQLVSPLERSPRRQQQKRQEHQIQLMYNQEMHQKHKVKQLMENVENKLKSYEGIISRQIKRQEDQIRERIQLRKMKSDSGSVKKFEPTSLIPGIPKLKDAARDRVISQFLQQNKGLDIKMQGVRQRNLVTTMRHQGI